MRIGAVHIEPPALSHALWPGLSLFLDGERMCGNFIKSGPCVLRTPSITRPASAQRLRVFCVCAALPALRGCESFARRGFVVVGKGGRLHRGVGTIYFPPLPTRSVGAIVDERPSRTAWAKAREADARFDRLDQAPLPPYEPSQLTENGSTSIAADARPRNGRGWQAPRSRDTRQHAPW